MNVLDRGVQLYLLGLAFVTTLAIVWGANRFLLENTSTGTGWPLMMGLAGLLLLLGVIVRHRRDTGQDVTMDDQDPWSRNDP